MKLDFRCRAIGCTQGNHCRRFLTGDAAKNCAVPFAAFDTRRDTVDCDGYLQRAWVGNAGKAQSPLSYEVVADDVQPSSDPGAWTCQCCGFRGFWRGGPHCVPRNDPHNTELNGG